MPRSLGSKLSAELLLLEVSPDLQTKFGLEPYT